MTGHSDHPHWVNVSVTDFEKLSNKGMIKLKSSFDNNHDHVIIIKCEKFQMDHPNPRQLRNLPIPVNSPDRKKGY